MKIYILDTKNHFDPENIQKLTQKYSVKFLPNNKILTPKQAYEFLKDADIAGIIPEPLGGFKKAQTVLKDILPKLTNLKAIALGTTSFEYLDLDYCKKHNILVTNVPKYATEAVAEHIIALILGLAKTIFLSDRRTQQGKFKFELGQEVLGKTLGIIGFGAIGKRTAELAQVLGMKVIAYNRSHKKAHGIQFLSLKEVLKKSDFISISVAVNNDTINFLNSHNIRYIKKGAYIVNLASDKLVDDTAMAKALKQGLVKGYAYETDTPEAPPLGALENAFGFKIFSWYTKEALERASHIWVENILRLANQLTTTEDPIF